MADISFLMLIFFLMVSTMDPETGSCPRRLPPMPPEDAQVEDLKVNRRNMLDVKINSRNGVMAGGQVILSDAQLEEIVIEFLTNPPTVRIFLRRHSRTSRDSENILFQTV